MTAPHTQRVYDFVRAIISARTGEPIEVVGWPEKEFPNIPAVEELWASASYSYAMEHTRVEAFEGQIGNEANVVRLLTPLRQLFDGRIPGDFRIAVREADLRRLPLAQYDVVRAEIARLIVEISPTLEVGASATLASAALPFSPVLARRDGRRLQLLIVSHIDADPQVARLERLRRAAAKKLPKLDRWSRDGRRSVLILEWDDFQHSNAELVSAAALEVLGERSDQPHTLALVDSGPGGFHGWVRKAGEYRGDAVPKVNGVWSYVDGQIAGLPRYR